MRKLAFFLGLAIAIFVSAQVAQATHVIDDALQVNSLKVGQQGEGGVTYFNGTIVNETTGEDDADNPVTFGDDVRIVNDNMEVTGILTAGSFTTEGSFSVGDLYVADEIMLTRNIRQDIDGEGALKAWAFVRANSFSVGSTGWYLVATDKVDTGKYEITFGIDISAVDSQSGIRYPTRAIIATPSGGDGDVNMRIISAAPHATDTNKVLVWTMDADGNYADSDFTLAIF